MADDTKASYEWLTGIVEGVRTVQNLGRELIDQAKSAQNAYHVLGQYEALRLQDARGEDDPAVLQLNERLRLFPSQVQEMGLADELERISVPKTAENDMLVHGRVTDENSRGVVGLTVALTDKEGNRLDVEDVEADASGYFAFVLDPEKIKAVAERKTDVYLTVMNQKGEVCYRRPRTLKVKEGERLLEDVVLTHGDAAAGATETKDTRTPRAGGVEKRTGKKDK